jgi:hypothetical protein
MGKFLLGMIAGGKGVAGWCFEAPKLPSSARVTAHLSRSSLKSGLGGGKERGGSPAARRFVEITRCSSLRICGSLILSIVCAKSTIPFRRINSISSFLWTTSSVLRNGLPCREAGVSLASGWATVDPLVDLVFRPGSRVWCDKPAGREPLQIDQALKLRSVVLRTLLRSA